MAIAEQPASRDRVQPRTGTVPSSDAADTAAPRRKSRLSPLNQRRWQSFKANRRGYVSLWIFAILFVAYFYIRRGAAIGVFAGLLLFFNPTFSVAGSDFWNANFIFIPVWLALILLLEISEKRMNEKWVFAIPSLLAVAAQIHFAVLFVLPIPLVLFLWKRISGKGWLWLGLGGLIAGLFYLPYLASEIQNEFENTRAMLAASKGHLRYIEPKLYAFWLFPTNEMSYYLGTGWPVIKNFYFSNPLLREWGLGFFGWIAFVFNVVTVLFSVAANLFWISRIPWLRRRFKWEPSKVPALYQNGVAFAYLTILITFVVFSVLRIPGGGFHYFFALFPLAFFPLLGFLEYLKERSQKIYRIAFGFFLVNAAVIALLMAVFFQLYYAPLRYQAQVAMVKKVLAETRGEAFRLYTTYENANPGDYQKYGVPRFYEGIATEILKVPWNERPDGKRLFAIEAYDPSFNLTKVRFASTNNLRELWRDGNFRLFEVMARF